MIYDQNGKKASYKDILNSSQKSDVLLFGEYHDNSVAHWLELEITKDLFELLYTSQKHVLEDLINQGKLSYRKGKRGLFRGHHPGFERNSYFSL